MLKSFRVQNRPEVQTFLPDGLLQSAEQPSVSLHAFEDAVALHL